MRKKILLIISAITLIGSGLYGGLYLKNLPYQEIDALIKRVNERVLKVPELTLYERDGYQANTLKFTQVLYSEKTVEKNGTREICENLEKSNILCESNEFESSYGKVYVSFKFNQIEYSQEDSILRVIIYKYRPGVKWTEGNTNTCEYAVNKENEITKERVYLSIGKNNHENNVISDSINEFFIDCVSDEALREQLLKQKYDSLEPVMKQWVEEYVYASKVFKKIKYTN